MFAHHELIAAASFATRNANFDVSTYPIRAQGTTDGIQWSDVVETVLAATDVEVLLFQTYTYLPRLRGTLAWVYYVIQFQLKAGTATADLKWKIQAKNKDGTWTDMCAEQTETNIGTAYVDKVIKGYLDIKTNITQIPFELRLIVQSSESKNSVVGTDIAIVDGGGAADTITSVAGAFGDFVVGDIITISGSAADDGDYTLTGAAAGTLSIVTGSITGEAAGSSITIATTGQAYGKVKNTTYVRSVGSVGGIG